MHNRANKKESITTRERKAPIPSTASNDLAPRAAELLARLEALPLSAPGDPLGFECRLADENGWTLGRAQAVVREYRRFLVLTQVAGEPVCPSDDVDQAWHLHITCTADYTHFCRDAFGAFLHHRPSRGGADELARHRAMYASTLAGYRSAFGAKPAADIWPAVDDRFAPRRRESIPLQLRLPAMLEDGRILAAFSVGLAAALGFVAGELHAFDALHAIPGPIFLEWVVPALLLLFVAGRWSRRPLWMSAAVPSLRLDPYEVAWLAGGARRMAATAIGVMVDCGALALRSEPGRRPRDARTIAVVTHLAGATRLHPVERACLGAARDAVLDFERAARALAPQAAAVRRRLVAAGAAHDPARLSAGRFALILATGLILAIGLERLLHSLAVPHPHGGLFFIEVAGAALLVGLARRAQRATRSGFVTLRRLRTSRRFEGIGNGRRRAPVPADLPIALALLGAPAVMADPRFGGIEQAIGKEGLRAGDASASGCSGGSGSDGGGGGCGGGCGGCGG